MLFNYRLFTSFQNKLQQYLIFIKLNLLLIFNQSFTKWVSQFGIIDWNHDAQHQSQLIRLDQLRSQLIEPHYSTDVLHEFEIKTIRNVFG